MVYENIIVRADFVDGQVVPLCFQATQNSPRHTIGRITSISYGFKDNATLYECRMAKSDETATLVLKNDGNTLNWSVTADWDLTKPVNKTDNEQATDLLVEKPQNSEKSAEQITEKLKQLRKKAEGNNKDAFGAAMGTLIYGILFFFTFAIPSSSSFTHLDVFKAILHIGTACGFAVFGMFLIGTLIVKLVYHITERKLSNGIITEKDGNRSCLRS